MTKNIISLLVLAATLLRVDVIFARDQDVLGQYIRQNFPASLQISSAQLAQLTWVLGHDRRSNDMDMQASANGMHIEIVRAVTRLYCLQLLKSGRAQDYDDFISAQLKTNENKTLTFNSFKKLSRHIQKLKSLDYQLLEVATILSAVSLTSQAFTQAKILIDTKPLVADNLEFLSATLRKDPNIYPLTKNLVNDNISAKKLLYVLFPPQTNFRHMLYTEGGVGMFKYLRTMIKHQYINADEIDLWYAYWLVNIAGFRGHVEHAGSLYLTEPVFQAMNNLKSMLDEMVHAPNFNPLLPYLEYRAELLGFSSLPADEKLMLAHIGAMMRLYTVEEGQQLQIGYTNLNKQLKQELAADFANSLIDYERLTPTYLPALLGNTLVLLNGDINKTVKTVLPIYHRALRQYYQSVANGALKPSVPLGFNNLSATKNVQKLIESDTNNLAAIKIMSDGEVYLAES